MSKSVMNKTTNQYLQTPNSLSKLIYIVSVTCILIQWHTNLLIVYNNLIAINVHFKRMLYIIIYKCLPKKSVKNDPMH